MNGALRREDRRPERESLYIRLASPATAAELRSIRLGPETLIDHLPNGRTAPARHPLTGGVDDMAGMVDNVDIGADNADAELRTGRLPCATCRTSAWWVLGQGSARLQAEAISHCESMRYPSRYPGCGLSRLEHRRSPEPAPAIRYAQRGSLLSWLQIRY